MALPTTTEQLEELYAARSRILSGHQESRVNGRQYRMADLEALNAEIERLERKLAAEAGMRVRQVVPRG